MSLYTVSIYVKSMNHYREMQLQNATYHLKSLLQLQTEAIHGYVIFNYSHKSHV